MEDGVHGIYIMNRRVLVVKKNEFWILPGGKSDFSEEKDEDILKREFREELSGTEILVEKYYNTFEGITPHNKIPFKSKTYFCCPLHKVGKPSSEISEFKYINSKAFENLPISEITKKTLVSLINDGYID
ncbi:MAG: NUDIX domain-containing protein [Candidatus Pacearchaeota archaeon]|jgi:8-oxo-dGTP pyrophosphatase MutT (NUDIX family)